MIGMIGIIIGIVCAVLLFIAVMLWSIDSKLYDIYLLLKHPEDK